MWILEKGDVHALQHLSTAFHLVAEPEQPCMIGDSIILADDMPAFRSRSFTIRTLNTNSLCKIWELSVANLWSILRMYPNIRTDMMDHVRNRTLVQLAPSVKNPADEEDRMPKISGSSATSWCEAATSISGALLRQPQEFIDLTMEELLKAKIEDASLQQLLDMLLEFSMNHSRKPIDVASNLAFFSHNVSGGTTSVDMLQSGSPAADGSKDSDQGRSSFTSRHSASADRVRAALGLQSAKPQWRPGRLGRQTLFRVSSLAGSGRNLASSSIPVQEFGVGYTNYG